MAAPTTQFDLERVRDLKGRHRHAWYRRVALSLMAAVVVLALLGVFGQSPATRTASGPAGTLTVQTPERLRGGILWPGEIRVRARTKIVAPVIVLGGGFMEGMQLNTLVPAATSEASRPPRPGQEEASLALTYPTLEAGDELSLFLQLQVDPTTVGLHDLSVRLEGANIAPIDSPLTARVFP